MVDRRRGASRSGLQGLAPVQINHPDLIGWEPVLGGLRAIPGSTAEIVGIRAADQPGDIAGRAYRSVAIVITEPSGAQSRSEWLYRRTTDADGPDPFLALKQDFERRLATDDLLSLSERIPSAELLSQPLELPNSAARKAFHSYVQTERDLAGWEHFFADHSHGRLHMERLRRLVENTYRLGRWAREMELAPTLQPKIDVGRRQERTWSKGGNNSGLAEKKRRAADESWRTLSRQTVRKELREDPTQEASLLIEALRDRQDTKGDIRLPKRTILIRRAVEEWVREFLSETGHKLASD